MDPVDVRVRKAAVAFANEMHDIACTDIASHNSLQLHAVVPALVALLDSVDSRKRHGYNDTVANEAEEVVYAAARALEPLTSEVRGLALGLPCVGCMYHKEELEDETLLAVHLPSIVKLLSWGSASRVAAVAAKLLANLSGEDASAKAVAAAGAIPALVSLLTPHSAAAEEAARALGGMGWDLYAESYMQCRPRQLGSSQCPEDMRFHESRAYTTQLAHCHISVSSSSSPTGSE